MTSIAWTRLSIFASIALPAGSVLYLNGVGDAVEWFSTYRPLVLAAFSYYGMMALATIGVLRLITLGGVMVKETDLPVLAKAHCFLLLLATVISWLQNSCELSPFWGCLNTLFITGTT